MFDQFFKCSYYITVAMIIFRHYVLKMASPLQLFFIGIGIILASHFRERLTKTENDTNNLI